MIGLVLLVLHDTGGGVDDRLRMMRDLGPAHVEIRGECLSACTMFLGLPDVCVSPGAVLGFHGPTTPLPGIPLPPDDWERATQTMAAQYPPRLRRWFLSDARYYSGDYLTLTGEQVINLGAKPCG